MHDLDRQQLERFDETGYGEAFPQALGLELDEGQEMALASEFLEVTDEEELEGFLDDLFRRTATAARRIVNVPTVRQALPAVTAAGRALLPGVPMAGAAAGMLADQLLKEELEGLSAEDREFEGARRFVRFANAALQHAARTPERVPPAVAAQVAVRDTARDLLPGIVPFVGQLFGPDSGAGDRGVAHETADSPLGEAQELELAGELLEVASEEELEEFLGNLLKGVAKGVGKALHSPVGRQLGGMLKGVAKTALPMVGGAIGSFVAPGLGTAVGSRLGSLAASALELEDEGFGDEELEFETARRVVRLAATSASQAAQAPAGAPPRQVARAALVHAARVHGALPAGARGGSRPGRPPSPARGGARRRRPLGAVAYPVGTTTLLVPSGNGNGGGAADATGGAGDWPADEPGDEDAGTTHETGGSGRPTSGRWYRRGGKLVLVGV